MTEECAVVMRMAIGLLWYGEQLPSRPHSRQVQVHPGWNHVEGGRAPKHNWATRARRNYEIARLFAGGTLTKNQLAERYELSAGHIGEIIHQAGVIRKKKAEAV